MDTFEPKHMHLFTGLNLYLEREEVSPAERDDKGHFVKAATYQYSVTLEGDAVKEEYLGSSEKDASDVFTSIVEHYKWREAHDPLGPDGKKQEYKHYPARPLNA